MQNGAYFVYLDIGVNGGSGSSPTKVAQLDKIGFVENKTVGASTYSSGNTLGDYLTELTSKAFIINAKQTANGITAFKKVGDNVKYASSTNNITLTPFGDTPSSIDSGLLV